MDLHHGHALAANKCDSSTTNRIDTVCLSVPDETVTMSSSAGLSPPLAWRDGEKDFGAHRWKHGTVFPPSDRKFHQHFNASKQPVRYLATSVGGLRYPLTLGQPRSCCPSAPPTISSGIANRGVANLIVLSLGFIYSTSRARSA
jgi:hypothetical protein